MKNISNATEKNPRPNLVGSPKILSQSSEIEITIMLITLFIIGNGSVRIYIPMYTRRK